MTAALRTSTPSSPTRPGYRRMETPKLSKPIVPAVSNVPVAPERSAVPQAPVAKVEDVSADTTAGVPRDELDAALREAGRLNAADRAAGAKELAKTGDSAGTDPE